MFSKSIGYLRKKSLGADVFSGVRFCIAALIITSSLLFGGVRVSAQCPEGMTAYWPFNEKDPGTYLDEISGLSAFCVGDCPQSVGGGRVGRAQRFDGLTQRLAVEANDAFNWEPTDSFTIAYWVRMAGGMGGIEKVAIGRFDPDTGLHWSSGVSVEKNAFFRVADVQGITHSLIATRSLNDGRWHHVAIVGDMNGLELKLYLDGAEEGAISIDFEAVFGSESANLTIGWSSGNIFSGDLDEMALWQTALSPEQISSHFHNGLADFRWGYCEEPEALHLMPLGDSITAGVETLPDGSDLSADLMVSYRQALYLNLVGNGYSVDFVGSQSYGQAALPEFDVANEAYPGFSDQQIAGMVHRLLTNNPADIVLLHIGTNGLNIDPGDVETILDEIDRYDPETTVVLARIINRKSYSQDTSDFNANIETMAMARIAGGDKIIIVDMENALAYPDDMSDNLHPNESGYEKMFITWRDALYYEGAFDRRAPVIESVPVEEGSIGSVYVYDLRADGLPTPKYRFAADSTVPDGMTIDGDSGRIEWPISRDGQFSMVVEAYNSEGFDRQAFTITVPFTNQPPIADAGRDQVVLEGATVVLNGTASSDPDGGIASYRWRQIIGTSVSLSNSSMPTPTFIAPKQDVSGLVFELSVTDKGGLTDTDEVRISINSNGINIFPDDVVSFTTVTGRPLGIRVDDGGALVFLESIQDGTIGDADGRPQDFIYGLVDAEVNLASPGGTLVVTFFLPSRAPDGYLWYGHTESNGWFSFGNDAVFNEERDQVRITLTEGGFGDASSQDGVIRLRSGLAVMPAPEKVEKDELIGCFIQSAVEGGQEDCRSVHMARFYILVFMIISVAVLLNHWNKALLS